MMEKTVQYPVMEAFYTLQGEGANAGIPAFFIRLAGCDVGCHWCDVKESWDASLHPLRAVEDLLSDALQYPARNIVITGGEPCMHDLSPLCNALKNAGFNIWLETSGSSPISGKFDWICLSPKKFKKPLTESYAMADELKVVVFHKSDLTWAEQEAARVRPSCALFLQPEWERRKEMEPLLTAYIMQHPRWRMSVQTHKYLGIP
jgi:organic radical activating enzyme